MITTLLIIFWMASGIVSFGIHNKFEKARFGYFNVFPFGIFPLLGGPVGLIASIVTTIIWNNSFGFDLVPYSREQRWKIFDSIYNNDGFIFRTREQFDKEY